MTNKTTNKKLNVAPGSVRPSRSGGAAVADWSEEIATETRPQSRPSRAPAAVHVNWPSTGADSFARRYGMDEQSLAVRRQFIRLGDEERQLLGEMAPWAQENAADIAREFYEWQFQFPATRQFFEGIAAEKGISIGALREHLESAQMGYVTEVFAGASVNWDLRYFEKRLSVGSVHDRINLPFKWYVGSYPEFLRVVGQYLRRDIEDLERVLQIEGAVGKVFNLDLQAIGDAFILNTMERMLASCGIRLDDICSAGDRAEQVGKIKQAMATQLDSFISSLKHMSEEHEKGEIDVVLSPDKFVGSLSAVAASVNRMVAEPIAINKKVLGCFAEFGKGNF
jgi:hypothetical protein